MNQNSHPEEDKSDPQGNAKQEPDSTPKRRGRQGISRETVQAAMLTLRSRLGREATLAELRAETGTGSMTTLTRHRRAVLDERLMQSRTPISRSTEASLLAAVSSVHAALSKEIAEAAEVDLANEVERIERDAWDRITRMDQERLLAEQQRDEGVRELIGARATITALEARVEAAETARQTVAAPLEMQTNTVQPESPPERAQQLEQLEHSRQAAESRIAQLEKAELVLQTRLDSANKALANSEARMELISNDLALAVASLKNRSEDQAQTLLAQSQTLTERLQLALETLTANSPGNRR